MGDTIELKGQYEAATVHSRDPVVAVRDNVISPIECTYLIELQNRTSSARVSSSMMGIERAMGGQFQSLAEIRRGRSRQIDRSAACRYCWFTADKCGVDANHPLRPNPRVSATL